MIVSIAIQHGKIALRNPCANHTKNRLLLRIPNISFSLNFLKHSLHNDAIIQCIIGILNHNSIFSKSFALQGAAKKRINFDAPFFSKSNAKAAKYTLYFLFFPFYLNASGRRERAYHHLPLPPSPSPTPHPHASKI